MSSLIGKILPKFPAKDSVYNPTLKYMPTLAQIKAALQELPDPETYSELRFICPVKIDKQIKNIEFKRMRVNRGSKRPYRWIYEGKILIRNQDI